MKKDAIVLNGGRGSAVDCTALARTLAQGHLWGAGLDVTDPEPLPSEIDGLKGRPEAENLVTIYGALSNRTAEDILREYGGGQFSTFKQALVDLSVASLSPIGDEMRRLVADPASIDAILAEGSARARAIAEPVMREVRAILGFIQS